MTLCEWVYWNSVSKQWHANFNRTKVESIKPLAIAIVVFWTAMRVFINSTGYYRPVATLDYNRHTFDSTLYNYHCTGRINVYPVNASQHAWTRHSSHIVAPFTWSCTPYRRRLRSSSSSLLAVRRTRLSTVGDRAFPVIGSPFWNTLPASITSAPSLSVFRSRLKSHLFERSFPADCYLHLPPVLTPDSRTVV